MKGSRAALAAMLAAVLVAGACRKSAPAVNLIDKFDEASKAPAAGPFQVIDADLAGTTARAISTPTASRITWKVQVPEDAWLRVSVGTRSDSWTKEGDGSYFLVGVSDGKSFDILFSQHVNPFANSGDRKWIPVWVDLSAYAGEEVDLIFNTRASPERADDARNDAPLWGAPEIVVR